jgi:hypothetical protein
VCKRKTTNYVAIIINLLDIIYSMKQKYLFAGLLLLVAGLQSMKAQEAYAVYNSDNTTLTFYYDTQMESRSGQKYVMNSGESQPGSAIIKPRYRT